MKGNLALTDQGCILVLGGDGMAGHMVATYLSEAGRKVIRTSRRGSSGSVDLDATDESALTKLVSGGDFSAVVNCIGALVAESQEDPLSAIILNAAVPRVLERASSKTNTQIIHLSTDCVFSGTSGPYVEDAFRDGDSTYDRAKALGELNNPKDLTLRMSIVGPETRVNGTGLLHWFLGNTGEVGGYTRAIWNGITTLELAKAVDAALDTPTTGIYNLVPDYSITKYDLLWEVARAFVRTDLRLRRDSSVVLDKTLVDTRRSFPFNVGKDGYAGMMDELSAWVAAHPELYGYDRRYTLGPSE